MQVRKKSYSRRSLEDLTIKDNFLFTAVMSKPEISKELLQIILNIEIEHVEVDYEKSIITHPEYRSIRLDVYIKDESNTIYNIEMQVASEKLEKRTRYYHSQMDQDILGKSVPYEELPDSYVIFICDFDPFGLGKYCYTVRKTFVEDPDHDFQDGSHTIFLSTAGHNKEDISDELYQLLHFIKTDNGMIKATENTFLHKLQDTIANIKRDRNWGDRFMRLEELIEREKKNARLEGLAEGRAEGLAEGRAEGLAEGRAEGRAEGLAEGLESAAVSVLKDCIISFANSKNCDPTLVQTVETCTNSSELRKIYDSLLHS